MSYIALYIVKRMVVNPVRTTNIEDIGNNYPVVQEELRVNYSRPQSSTALILFGLLVLVGLYFGFGRPSSLYVKTGVIIVLLLIGRIEMIDRNKPRPGLTIHAGGILLYSKDFYSWEDIREITYEVEEKGMAVLVFRFYDGRNLSFPIDKRLDQPIEVIAAYINKYWKRDHYTMDYPR